MTEFLKSVNKWFIVSHDLFELTRIFQDLWQQKTTVGYHSFIYYP